MRTILSIVLFGIVLNPLAALANCQIWSRSYQSHQVLSHHFFEYYKWQKVASSRDGEDMVGACLRSVPVLQRSQCVSAVKFRTCIGEPVERAVPKGMDVSQMLVGYCGTKHTGDEANDDFYTNDYTNSPDDVLMKCSDLDADYSEDAKVTWERISIFGL